LASSRKSSARKAAALKKARSLAARKGWQTRLKNARKRTRHAAKRTARKSPKTVTLRSGGKKITIAKRKGDRWRVGKGGKVTRTRKGPRGEKIKGTMIRVKRGQTPPPPPPGKQYQYAIPFARKVAKGRYRLEWQRFPSYESLNEFMSEYDRTGRYTDWRFFVFKEEVSDVPKARRDELLNEAAIAHGRATPDELGVRDYVAPRTVTAPITFDPSEI
jgi:hypothetical protein